MERLEHPAPFELSVFDIYRNQIETSAFSFVQQILDRQDGSLPILEYFSGNGTNYRRLFSLCVAPYLGVEPEQNLRKLSRSAMRTDRAVMYRRLEDIPQGTRVGASFILQGKLHFLSEHEQASLLISLAQMSELLLVHVIREQAHSPSWFSYPYQNGAQEKTCLIAPSEFYAEIAHTAKRNLSFLCPQQSRSNQNYESVCATFSS